MDLIDVKRTAEDKKKEKERWSGDSVATMEDYPYGLQLHLDDDTIDKLGLSDADFDAGQPVAIIASGMISSENLSLVAGKRRHSMTIQIQKLNVHQEAQKVALADTLYGAEKK